MATWWLKRRYYEEEVGESNKALSTLKAKIEEVRTVILPTLDDKRAILYIKKTGKTPKQYPRKPKKLRQTVSVIFKGEYSCL